MDKQPPSSLFVNDGSFMERFKQLQQEKAMDKDAITGDSKSKLPASVPAGASTSGFSIPKARMDFKGSGDCRKTVQQPSSGGKLAFSLKQKSKIVAPAVKLGADEDEDESDVGRDSGDTSAKRQRLDGRDANEKSSKQFDFAPPSPSDPTVKSVADRLATFVAKNGRHLEDVTRQKNPGNTPFKFLFDKACAEYKYYEYRLAEEEKALSLSKESQTSGNGGAISPAAKSNYNPDKARSRQPNYQTPASALYDAVDDSRADSSSANRSGESSSPPSNDPIAMMEFYMKKAAQEERRRQPKQSKDEMPPPASLQGSAKKGHHMGDFIPQEELEKFLAACNSVDAEKAAREAAERARIQADNVGHRLLSKMGWKEGEGLGSSRRGIADPIMAGDVKKDHLGVGAHNPGEVQPEDDIYEQYKKRMMLGYRYRPNPLNNPRKAYY